MIIKDKTDELWDVYTRDRELTGRTHRRGNPLNACDYHLVVHVWLLTKDGKILLTQRSRYKEKNPLKWEGPGGSVIKGETPIEGAYRETLEEIGLDISKENFSPLINST